MKAAINKIEVGKRLRDLDEDAVADIAGSFEDKGQLQPIILRNVGGGKFKLIAGGHRLAAAKKIGWKDIEYKEAEDHGDSELNDEDDIILEAIENLKRKNLTPLQDSEHANAFHDATIRFEARKRVIEAEEAARNEKAEKGKVEDATRKRRDRARTAEAADGSNQNFGTKRPVQGKRWRTPGAENKPVNRKASAEIKKEVQSQRGLKSSSVALLFRRYPVALEVCKAAGVDYRKLVGTTLDKDSELDALGKLWKANPTKAKDCVKSAIRLKGSDQKIKATADLKALDAQITADKKKKRESEKAGRYQSYTAFLSSALSAIDKAGMLADSSGDTQERSEFAKLGEAISASLAGYKTKAGL